MLNNFPPKSTVFSKGWSLPEWSPLWDYTLRVSLLVFLLNTRLRLKRLTVSNALAYYDLDLPAAIKMLITLGPGVIDIKLIEWLKKLVCFCPWHVISGLSSID